MAERGISSAKDDQDVFGGANNELESIQRKVEYLQMDPSEGITKSQQKSMENLLLDSPNLHLEVRPTVLTKG